MFHKKLVAIPLLLVGFSACSSSGAGNATFTTRDSSGIHIAENVSPTWGDEDAWHLGDAPLVDIGAVEGDPAYELYRASSAVRLPDGRIVIGNSGTQEIRFYSESGTHLFAAGGAGEGPGEFSVINWVTRYRGDSVVAYDMRQMRISVFDSDGTFVRSYSLPGMEASTRGSAQGVFENGSVFSIERTGSMPDDASEGFRQEEPLYTVNPDGEFEDSLIVSPGTERFIHTPDQSSSGPTMVFLGSPMFGKST